MEVGGGTEDSCAVVTIGESGSGREGDFATEAVTPVAGTGTA